MPIYAYRCEACGFTKDALQKVSDAPLTVCPSCGQSTFKKQLTAARFQLKGTGWYVTDFREGANSSKKTADAAPQTSTTSADSTASGTAATETSSTSGTTPDTSKSTSPPSTGSDTPSAT